MNKRHNRPSSTTSGCSKKSLNDSMKGPHSMGNSIVPNDNTSIIHSSLSSVSICERGHSSVIDPSVVNKEKPKPKDTKMDGIFSSQSENNLRKSHPSIHSSSQKDKRYRDRISFRNFISRTFFSSSGSSAKERRSSTSLSEKEKNCDKTKGRKQSSISSRSSPTALHQITQTPTSTASTHIPVGTVIGDRRSVSSTTHAAIRSVSAAGDPGSLWSGEGLEIPDENQETFCSICYELCPPSVFPQLINSKCHHAPCLQCYRKYLTVQITESRVNLTCPECDAVLHPNDVQAILDDPILLAKYEHFMIRRVLAGELDTRWCPAPDCGYAVIASGCAECPRLVCERTECGTAFCYHCAGVWHPVSTCDEARAQRFGVDGIPGPSGPGPRRAAGNALFSAAPSSLLGKIKPCPRCRALIAKMDDGSCNHMTCTICGADFCWLCMKEISDLHFLSPTGCTFWGKKPWSRKKKLICQLGTLIGAPVGIALVAGVAVPSMIIGIPIWVGRKIHRKMLFSKRYRRNLAVLSGVTAAVLLSPAVAALVVGFGVPLMLAYVYGVVPFSLCRNGGTCRLPSNASDNSVANSTSNLSAADEEKAAGTTSQPEQEDNSVMHRRLRLRSSNHGGSLELSSGADQLQACSSGSGRTPADEQLMLRMMMVLDENDVVFVNQSGEAEGGELHLGGSQGKLRHRAEINLRHAINSDGASSSRQHQPDHDHTSAVASIGEFSLSDSHCSADAQSQRSKLVLVGGFSPADVDAAEGTSEVNMIAPMESELKLRPDVERPSFDSASALAFRLSVRRQSGCSCSESVTCSLAERQTLETLSSDFVPASSSCGSGAGLGGTLGIHPADLEQDNASTKALAGSILGRSPGYRENVDGSTRLEKTPSSSSILSEST